jgi:hypothetical protein
MKIKMNQFKKIFGLLLLLPIAACSNASSNSNANVEKNNVSKTVVNPVPETSVVISGGNPITDLEKAKSEGKVVFLVITGTGATNLDKAIVIAKEANSKYKKSTVIQLNRDEAANFGLVSKFGISSVPVPFILVISPKGLAVGGLAAATATADQLIATIPSPKEDEVIFALSEKKPVFIVVSKKGLTDKTGILKNCKSASSKIASKPTIIEIDYSDPKEKDFLTRIGITPLTDKSKTVVANVSGQITATYDGIPLESDLITSANKVIKGGGCSPGGCAPSGCGPKK